MRTWGDLCTWIYIKETQKAAKKRKTTKKSKKYLTTNPSAQSKYTTICALGFASRRLAKGILRVTRPSVQGSGDLRYKGQVTLSIRHQEAKHFDLRLGEMPEMVGRSPRDRRILPPQLFGCF